MTPVFSRVVRFLLILAAIFPVGYTTYHQWPAVQETLLHVRWPFLVFSMLLLFVSMPLMGVIPWLTLRSLQVRRSVSKVVGFYFVSQVTKYLPGGVWAYPTRVAAYQVDGVGKVQAVVSVAREVVFLFLGAALIASLAPLVGVFSPGWMQWLVALGMAGCSLVLLLTSSSKLFASLSKLPFLQIFARALGQGEAITAPTWSDLLQPLLTGGIYWLGAGISFLYLVKAVTPGATLHSLQAIVLFSLAWCVGFMIIILPAGFGARETAILYLLKNFIPLADAVAVSILARLCWMAAEAAWTVLLASRVVPRKRDDDERGSFR